VPESSRTPQAGLGTVVREWRWAGLLVALAGGPLPH